MNSYKVEAVVLGGRNLGEADRIVTLFTRQHGKLKVVAKGVRKLTSRKAGHLIDFARVKLVLVKGRSLDIITEVETLPADRTWRDQIVKVGLGYYLVEVVERLTAENQEHPKIFGVLTEGLDSLGHRPGPVLVREFEESVLNELGFGVPPNRRHDQRSLVNCIEEVIEREIKSKEVLRKLKHERLTTS